MKRFIIGLAVFVIIVFAGYTFFWPSQPTAMVVSEEPVVKPILSDVVVKEERIERPKQVIEEVSQNSLAFDSVWVFNTADGSVLDVIRVGVSPVDILVSQNGWWLYVLNAGSKSISVIEAESAAVVKTVPLIVEPRSMSLSPDGRLLAVVSYSNQVLVFDTKDFKIVASAVVGGKKPSDVLFANEGKYLFVTTERSNGLEKLNPYLGHAIGVASVGQRPVAVGLNSKDRAFVVNSGSDGVSIIDVIDMSRAKKYDVDVGKTPVDLVFDTDEVFAFVANKDGDSVSVFDVESFKGVADISVGDAPVALVYSADKDVVYTANSGSDDISVVNALTYEEIARWKAGSRPSALALSPTGKFLFVTMRGRSS